MRKLAVLILVLCFLSNTAWAGVYEAKKKTGEYEVGIKVDRNPLVLGDNNISIEIKDGGGKYVTDTKVLVNYYMPPMPRMPPMNYRTDAKLKKEQYRATMHFIMSGPWYIVVIINRAGKTSTAKFNVDVQ